MAKDSLGFGWSPIEEEKSIWRVAFEDVSDRRAALMEGETELSFVYLLRDSAWI
jgi:hypothetical protein